MNSGIKTKKYNYLFSIKCSNWLIKLGSNSLMLLGLPGKFKINDLLLVPAVCLLKIAFFEYFKDSSLIYSPKPGYSLSIT